MGVLNLAGSGYNDGCLVGYSSLQAGENGRTVRRHSIRLFLLWGYKRVWRLPPVATWMTHAVCFSDTLITTPKMTWFRNTWPQYRPSHQMAVHIFAAVVLSFRIRLCTHRDHFCACALGYCYIWARTDTTQQSGQTPDKGVEIKNVTVYVSGYTEADTTGMLPFLYWYQLDT